MRESEKNNIEVVSKLLYTWIINVFDKRFLFERTGYNKMGSDFSKKLYPSFRIPKDCSISFFRSFYIYICGVMCYLVYTISLLIEIKYRISKFTIKN